MNGKINFPRSLSERQADYRVTSIRDTSVAGNYDSDSDSNKR